MITKSDLLAGRDSSFASEYTDAISDNLDEVVEKVNQFLDNFAGNIKVTSGWRPASMNGMVKGALPKSNHITGNAVDLSDKDNKLMDYILANLDKATALGLYFEDFRWTPTWCHVQTVPPKSRKRIYVPSSALALAPNRWNGKYDSKYDK